MTVKIDETIILLRSINTNAIELKQSRFGNSIAEWRETESSSHLSKMETLKEMDIPVEEFSDFMLFDYYEARKFLYMMRKQRFV